MVDANNIASLETGFSLGSYTLANLRGDITFRRGLPGETYEGIGKGGLNLRWAPSAALSAIPPALRWMNGRASV